MPISADGTLRCLKLPPEQAANLLEVKNAHLWDKNITFREIDHKYWIGGDCSDLISSTTYIHKFFSEFDADMIISRILKSRKHSSDPSYKYYNMSAEDIKAMWKANGELASSLGTKMTISIVVDALV